jgi:hypothetical protein
MAEAIDLLRQGWSMAGWFGFVIAGLVLIIRWLRKPLIQHALGYISPRLKWSKWPKWVRRVFVLFGAFVGAIFTAVLGGQSIMAAIVASLPIAIGAMGTHKITKAVGHHLTNTGMAKDPARYRSGSLRTSLDVIGLLPINHKMLNLPPEGSV